MPTINALIGHFTRGANPKGQQKCGEMPDVKEAQATRCLANAPSRGAMRLNHLPGPSHWVSWVGG